MVEFLLGLLIGATLALVLALARVATEDQWDDEE